MLVVSALVLSMLRARSSPLSFVAASHNQRGCSPGSVLTGSIGLGLPSFFAEQKAWALTSTDDLIRIKEKIAEAELAYNEAKMKTAPPELIKIAETDLKNSREAYVQLESLVNANDALYEVITQADVDIATWLDNHPIQVFGTLAILLVSAIIYAFQPANPQEINAKGELIEYPQDRPPTCTVYHILCPNRDLALKALNEMGPNVTFDNFKKMAKDISICPSAKSKKNPGNLGKLYLNMTDPEVEKVIFDDNLALNKPHGPVKTLRGHHIFWILDRDRGGKGAPVLLRSASLAAGGGDDD